MASVEADCGVIYRYEAQPNQLELITQHNLPGALLSEVHTLTLVPEITYWLETSTIPWLVNKGNSQQFPSQKLPASAFFKASSTFPSVLKGKRWG